MKRSISKTIVIMAVFFFVLAAVVAMAADTMVQAKVTDVKEKLDKNGAPFSIIVIQEERTLSGVTYSADVICTAFREAHEEAKTLKPGDTVKMIAAKREYNGDAAYTVRKILK